MARAVSVSSLYEGTPEEIFAILLERGKFAFQLTHAGYAIRRYFTRIEAQAITL